MPACRFELGGAGARFELGGAGALLCLGDLLAASARAIVGRRRPSRRGKGSKRRRHSCLGARPRAPERWWSTRRRGQGAPGQARLVGVPGGAVAAEVKTATPGTEPAAAMAARAPGSERSTAFRKSVLTEMTAVWSGPGNP